MPVQDGLALAVTLPPEHLDALAHRVAALLEEGRDEGFLDVEGAAKYLSSTPAAIRRRVERRTIPHYRAGGRVLFDRRELRAYVEAGR